MKAACRASCGVSAPFADPLPVDEREELREDELQGCRHGLVDGPGDPPQGAGCFKGQYRRVGHRVTSFSGLV